jgi:hypothetical protein
LNQQANLKQQRDTDLALGFNYFAATKVLPDLVIEGL